MKLDLVCIIFVSLFQYSLQSCSAGQCSCYSLGCGSECVTCESGTYSDGNDCVDTGSTYECPTCSSGLSSSHSSAYACSGSSTTSCPSGSGEVSGQTGCYECPSNTYNDGSSTLCVDCAAGSSSSAGSSTCTQCSTGYYSSSGGNCIACDAGHTSNADNTACVACSAGTYSSTSGTECMQCPVGSYSGSAATICSDCGTGYTSNTDNTGCSECAAGTYNSAYEGSCTECSSNTYSAAGATYCSYCDAGYIASTDHIECIPCPSGYYQLDNACYPCGPGTSSSQGSDLCSQCHAGTYSKGGMPCRNCPENTYNDYSGATSCSSCGTNLCSGYGSVECSTCTVGGLTVVGFSALLIGLVMIGACVYVVCEWNSVFLIALFGLEDWFGKPQSGDSGVAMSDDQNKNSGNPIHKTTTSVVEEGAVVTSQPRLSDAPGEKPVEKSMGVMELRRYDSVDGYQTVVDSRKHNLFSIPGLKVSSQVYGAVNFAMQLISFTTFIISFALSPNETALETQIYFALVYHVIVSWFVVPIWQLFSIRDDYDKDVSCEKKGCIYCSCCGICCTMMAGGYKFVPRPQDGCRYIPFSLYNLVFLFLSPGKELNNVLPPTMPYFGFGRIYMLLLSMNTKGTLNLYIFINACHKVFYNAAEGGAVTGSTVSAVLSLLFSFADLKVYAITTVFGLILLPFTVLTSFMFCCTDCCSIIDSLRAKNGSQQFKVFMKFWSYVNKY